MTAVQWTTIENAIQAWFVAGSGLAADHVIWESTTAPPSGQFIALRISVIEKLGLDSVDSVDNFLTVPPRAITAVNTATDALTVTGHGLVTGDGPLQLTTTGALPAPLAVSTPYWAVVVDANTIKLADTFRQAIAAPPTVIDLTASGSGSNSVAGTATTVRVGQEIQLRVRSARHMMLNVRCFGGPASGPGSPFAVLHEAIASHQLDARAQALNAAGIGVGAVEPIQAIDADPSTPGYDPHALATAHLHVVSELIENTTFIERVIETNQITNTTFTVSLT